MSIPDYEKAKRIKEIAEAKGYCIAGITTCGADCIAGLLQALDDYNKEQDDKTIDTAMKIAKEIDSKAVHSSIQATESVEEEPTAIAVARSDKPLKKKTTRKKKNG